MLACVIVGMSSQTRSVKSATDPTMGIAGSLIPAVKLSWIRDQMREW